MRRQISIILAISCLLIVAPGEATAAEAHEQSGEILLIELDGPVTAGQTSFVRRQLEQLDPADVQAAVVLLNTPGGLMKATLEMVQSFDQTPVPVVVFVTPAGAMAASAGAFIMMSADIAAMTPGTAVGSAKPVAVSPEGTQEADEKTVNMFASQIRSMAEEQGRPGDIAEEFVTENLSLDARSAHAEGAIELLAADLADLLEQLDGWTGQKHGTDFRLSTADAEIVRAEMTVSERLQDRISDPQLAFLILMAGGMGIYLGLGMPGTLVPETLGAILLVLGIYGIGLFDASLTGLILIALGFGLIAAEIFTGGFGILGVGGGVSLLIGSLMLPHEPLMAEDWYGTFRQTAIGVAITIVILCALIVTVVVRSRHRWRESGSFFRPADRDEVVEDLAPRGSVRMRGELWSARTEDGSHVSRGQQVKVIEQNDLTLIVRSLEENEVNCDGDDGKG